MDSLAIPNQNNVVRTEQEYVNETHIKEIQGLCCVRKTLSDLWLLDGAILHTQKLKIREILTF